MKPMQGNQWVNCAFGCLFKKIQIYIVLWDSPPSIYIQHVFEHTKDRAHSCLPHPALPILNGGQFGYKVAVVEAESTFKESSFVPFGETSTPS